jgi:hypothetical protein
MEKDLFNEIMKKVETNQIQTILTCNQYTETFGLKFSEEDAFQLTVHRKNTLKEQERLELGESILSKLIFTFCDSPHIYQDNYLDTIEALLELFYLYKSESLDELTDDELLAYMKEHFDGECEGSLEYLEDNCLEDFCRKIRSGTKLFIQRMDEEETDEY